jgi:hypothetical protein
MIPLSRVDSQTPQSFQSQGDHQNYTPANQSLRGMEALEVLCRETNLSPAHPVSTPSSPELDKIFSVRHNRLWQ